MKLFLDTSVLIAASASATGASRDVIRRGAANSWQLLTTPYVIQEVVQNLPRIPLAATDTWNAIRLSLIVVDDILTLDRPAVFEAAKDRPILFSALAWADVLLTLDRADFGALLNSSFYGLEFLKPGTFLERERQLGRLR